ncbi:hypothetical protein SAMN05192561_11227 [Halopenitus malekzadehii]|uniref:Uncharacterized protein n=1 Tax=Halopenitus malekzadehii TaxID=1267564 RepID=A0A1H6JEH8_9EURY|nr:hypothetical protein [Halopenitus malekzadehii]SEH60679.1 hypothetical protein SAMN05192561_11227 [Halopenitus malekzadehii]
MSRGIVCQDCIDHDDRHGHWPDESVDICIECRIDDGMIDHNCEESAADRVLLEPGSSCDYCEFEAPVTDGGSRLGSEDHVELPETLEEFVDVAEQKDSLRCDTCGEIVDRRWLQNGECVGCREGPGVHIAPRADGGER